MGFDQLSTKILISKTLSSKERIKPVPKYEGEYHLVCYCVIWCVIVSSGVLVCHLVCYCVLVRERENLQVEKKNQAPRIFNLVSNLFRYHNMQVVVTVLLRSLLEHT